MILRAANHLMHPLNIICDGGVSVTRLVGTWWGSWTQKTNSRFVSTSVGKLGGRLPSLFRVITLMETAMLLVAEQRGCI